ncbi:MAG TPA: alpha-glucosidase/alpha-galactosidase [Bacillota bacterium]
MQYLNDQGRGVKIAYIGGGSRGWAWRLMADLALEPALSGEVFLYDLDFEAAHDNEIIGNQLSVRDDVKGKWKYRTVKILEEALNGADFVVISIQPGTFKEMTSDVHLPEKYGIYQSVGDTVGPGGLVRALRTIPIYQDFAIKIKKYAPDAWIINYTNPMSLCTRTLYEVFPEIKAFGCCHEVFGTQKLLASMLKEELGIAGIPRDEIRINVLGINHFTWLDQASFRGTDLFPLYRKFVEQYYESGFEGEGEDTWRTNNFKSAQRVKFDLFKRYGLIAAAGDRHLAEFLPPTWYLKDPETVESWKFRLTPVDYRIGHQEQLELQRKRMIRGEEQLPLKVSGEEGVRQIKALLGMGDLITNVNLPNHGQMADLPLKAVVETNALFSRDRIRPVVAGALPPEINHLVVRHVWNQETILKAALSKNKETAFRAFINDPLVTIKPGDAEILFKEMLANTCKYLPGWKL